MSKTDDPNNRCGDLNDDVPVYNLSWDEAVEFCRRLTAMERSKGRIPDGYQYRLPTEAEWEYACRAGTSTALPNGRDIRILGDNNAPALDEIAWYGGNSSVGFGDGRGVETDNWQDRQYSGGRAFVREVKGKHPNRWGLYDMIGNVAEWCADWYGDYAIDNVVNPEGPSSGLYRIVRGGSWLGLARYCRAAQRNCADVGFRECFIGFRVSLAPDLRNDYLSQVRSVQFVKWRGVKQATPQQGQTNEGQIDHLLSDLENDLRGVAMAKRRPDAPVSYLSDIKKVPQERRSYQGEQKPYVAPYAYEARLCPYIIMNGVKKYVPAKFDNTSNEIFVRSDIQDGRYYIVVGSHTCPEGLLHVNLTYGRYSAKTWLSASMFNNQVKEVELK